MRAEGESSSKLADALHLDPGDRLEILSRLAGASKILLFSLPDRRNYSWSYLQRHDLTLTRIGISY